MKEDEDMPDRVALDVEDEAGDWRVVVVLEAPARDGEFPVRFIDGSQVSQLFSGCRAPAGWPIPLVLAEVGAVALRLQGRRFVREFHDHRARSELCRGPVSVGGSRGVRGRCHETTRICGSASSERIFPT